MNQHTDLKNTYLNEQGLKQERDALRAKNEQLREALSAVRVGSFGGSMDDGPNEDILYLADYSDVWEWNKKRSAALEK